MRLSVTPVIRCLSLLLLSCLANAGTTNALEPASEMLASAAPVANYQPDFYPLPEGYDAALVIAYAKNGDVLYSQRHAQFQPPASMQKLVTALAAELYLGKDYRFTTQLEQHENNVVLRFSGDPSLAREQLASLLLVLKGQVGATITGDLILNGGRFSGYEQAPGWPWDNLGICYSAPSSSLSLENNCVQGALYSNRRVGDKTRVTVPSHQPLTVISTALVTSKEGQKAAHCDLELTNQGRNHYTLSGCLVQRDEPLPLNFAVQDTEAYIANILRADLKRLGIVLKGDIKRDDSASGRLIARHDSAPLHELLETMIKDSDNLYADNIAKTIGANYFNQPGSFANGSAAIKSILKDKANIDLGRAILVDGSGLSRDNRMTAWQMMEVLSYIYRHDDRLNLLSILPISGQSGTLRDRQSIRQQPLYGQIRAKSGSLFGTYNLAGLLEARSGEILLFIQMISNYFPPERDESLPAIAPPIETFERKFYRSLYEMY
ncbi:MAG: serine-type D-Ala-D-Ala carboxypeptidase [Pseudomonadota bacterium]